MCEHVSLGVVFREERVVDAGGHITLGAEPLQYLLVVALVTRGEAAGMQVNHEAIMVARGVGGQVEVKSVCRLVPVGEIGLLGADGIRPLHGVALQPLGLDQKPAGNATREGKRVLLRIVLALL